MKKDICGYCGYKRCICFYNNKGNLIIPKMAYGRKKRKVKNKYSIN